MPWFSSQRRVDPSWRMPLRVRRADGQRARPKAGRLGRWRAAIMIAIYVAMTAHVLHWWITGRSLGRFVLSDSMRTLELGEINPGFLLFLASAVVTLLLGRFLCGWACHMAGLQDLCAWALRKVGVRPHLFCSRVLGYVPIALALYMFVWPTFKREVVFPVFGTTWAERSGLVALVPPFPGVRLDLHESRLWEGLPGAIVAIPFLVICGLGSVYFLGARGLCRYGCPYGGLLLQLDRFAPGRVVVDPSRCDQCGLCTSACTAGVRVHDEVRLFGAVRDRNCVRSLDCVAACPSDALSFGLRVPPVLLGTASQRPPAQAYDLSVREELFLLLVFVGSFILLRGLYDVIPMLLAATLSVLIAYFAWKVVRVWRDRDVRLARAQLKRQGRLCAAGWAFVASAGAAGLFFSHTAIVRVATWRAERADGLVTVSYEDALAQRNVSDSDRRHATRAIELFTFAGSWKRGGIAPLDTPESIVRLAWLRLVMGERDLAIEELHELFVGGRGDESVGVQYARLLLATRPIEEVAHAVESALLERGHGVATRELLAAMWIQMGQAEKALGMFRELVDRRAHDGRARAGLGRALFAQGRADEGLEELRRAAIDAPEEWDVRRDLAIAMFGTGRADDALAELRSAAKDSPHAKGDLLRVGAALLANAGRSAEASAWQAEADGRSK